MPLEKNTCWEASSKCLWSVVVIFYAVLCAQISLAPFPALISTRKVHFRRFKMCNTWILNVKISLAIECQKENSWELKALGS